ncbi:hypothetical protein PCANB_002797 [Pneumocystis canis]|nr:hypothetical protein PCK1_002930 [Pneumocystis canis]KAG5438309.1 hypothetical protein PCANB_002797 [Pneumocystis canis]
MSLSPDFSHFPSIAAIPSSRSSVIQHLIDGVDRYNPQNAPLLEEYLAQQCKNGTYDCMANLAILKLYQFNPHLSKDQVITNILVKALTVFTQPDFSTCLHLLPPSLLLSRQGSENNSLYEIVQKLHTLHLLLDAAKYKEFWQSISNDDLYTNLIADCIGFEDTIRLGISKIISQTMKEVKRDVLENWINLDNKKLTEWVQDIFHWEILGETVKLPENKDNVPVNKVTREKILFSDLYQLLR